MRSIWPVLSAMATRGMGKRR